MKAPLFLTLILGASLLRGAAADKDVLTFHNDNSRTGQYLTETFLTPANVNSNLFGRLWTLNVVGHVDAQPLYASGVSVPGVGVRNVLIIATEHDNVYAFDADSTNLLWHTSFLTNGATPANNGCSQVSPEVGVTATPVIDRDAGSNGTIFVMACTSLSGTVSHRLHALDLATGLDRMPATVVVATYPGKGANSSGGNVVFNPAKYEDRPALLLLGGVVYTTWASHCDSDPYTGWIIGYDENTLAQTSVLNVTPNGTRGAIWMAGDGPAADASGNIYFLDANGTFDATLNGSGFPISNNFGNGFLKISTASTLAVADYFQMSNTVAETAADQDLGSGGEILLPDMVDKNGVTRHLAVGAGKDKYIYVVDRDNMGKFNPNNNFAIYQQVAGVIGSVFSTPAYFNGTLYYGSVGRAIVAMPFTNARLTTVASQTAATFASPGATPSISANGTSNGIVWALANTSPAVLYAYNATNLAVKLYDSNQAANSRDHFGATGIKYVIPTIANGKVYAGTSNTVGVFGLFNPVVLTPPSQKISGITVDDTGAVVLSYDATTGFTYHVEAATNLIPATWVTLPGSLTNPSGTNVTFIDTNAAGAAGRYYRTGSP